MLRRTARHRIDVTVPEFELDAAFRERGEIFRVGVAVESWGCSQIGKVARTGLVFTAQGYQSIRLPQEAVRTGGDDGVSELALALLQAIGADPDMILAPG